MEYMNGSVFSMDADCMKHGHDMSDDGKCRRCGHFVRVFETDADAT